MTVVRALLDNWVSGAGGDSELAAKVLRWILQDGLPEPEVQLWVVANGDRYCPISLGRSGRSASSPTDGQATAVEDGSTVTATRSRSSSWPGGS